MDSNALVVSGARKMLFAFIVLTLLLTCSRGSELHNNRCDYIYDHGCSFDAAGEEYKVKSHRSCSVSDVTNDMKFTILRSKDGSTSSGVAKVFFTLPDVECNYDVELLVNSTISNEEDCKEHIFHETNSYAEEIHSIERTICVLPNVTGNTELNCEKTDAFHLLYEHVFTGCYALRFTSDGYEYAVRGNNYLVTDYNRTEVVAPKFRCFYEDLLEPESSKELVTFALSISVLSGTSGMILTLTPMSYLDEINENACIRYNQRALYTWAIGTENAEPALQNCSLTTVQFDNDTYTKDAECNFELRVPRNVSYCFELVLHDERCHRQTIWNPPPIDTGDKTSCTWLQRCTRIPKNISAVEYNVRLRGSKETNSDNILLLPIAITVILVIIIVAGTVLFVYRLHSRHARQRVYVNANLRVFKINATPTQIDSVETTDDETYKGSYNGDESDAIILLYARGSPTFMSFMTDFREILKIHCGCHVRDWYAASEWDAVARVGPAEWVADLLKQKYRALWIDTPRARALLDTQLRKNRANEAKRPYNYHLDEEAISDFRDIALPCVLDAAKRTVGPEPAVQYNKHFVVRLEGFEASNRREDPFEDLSPHTRYLVPYHLSDLCAHLSSWPTNINTQRLKTEETQLRERLISMKTNSS